MADEKSGPLAPALVDEKHAGTDSASATVDDKSDNSSARQDAEKAPLAKAAPEKASAPVKGRFDRDEHEEDADRQHHALVDMSLIELKAEDLYDKEKVDLEQIDLPDVWQLLQCDQEGLTVEEAARRLEVFGPNALDSKERSAILQLCVGASPRSRSSSQLVLHVEPSVVRKRRSETSLTIAGGSWRALRSSPSVSPTAVVCRRTGKTSVRPASL